jgi:hypothetical protein
MPNGAMFLEPSRRRDHRARQLDERAGALEPAAHFDVLHDRPFRETAVTIKCVPAHEIGLVAERRKRRIEARTPSIDAQRDAAPVEGKAETAADHGGIG